MFVPREVISGNNTQEFITRYFINDYTIKLSRCYNSGLILQNDDDDDIVMITMMVVVVVVVIMIVVIMMRNPH